MGLYQKWCDGTKEDERRKRYWTYVEKDGGRDEIRDDLAETMRSHYDRLERIADDVAAARLQGCRGNSACAAPPDCTRAARAISARYLATELVEEEIGLRVPVRRLRYKDGRNMAMRGDDFIGAGYGGDDEKLWLLKGEAKSNKVLGKATVTSARKVLNRDNGRCTPDSLAFVANRLLESNDEDDVQLGRSPPRRSRSEVPARRSHRPHALHDVGQRPSRLAEGGSRSRWDQPGPVRREPPHRRPPGLHRGDVPGGGRPWRRLTN